MGKNCEVRNQDNDSLSDIHLGVDMKAATGVIKGIAPRKSNHKFPTKAQTPNTEEIKQFYEDIFISK